VTATAASAAAAEPSAPAFPYAVITLSGGLTRPAVHTPFRAPALTTPPLRVWLGASDTTETDEKEPRARAIRLTLEPESMASFPIESEVPMCRASVPDTRWRWLTLRKDLDDGARCEALDGPYRLIRCAMEESMDAASMAARVVRTTLD